MPSGLRELKRALVTGADGFIGSHLVERLVAGGVEVTALCLYNSFNSWGWLDHYAAAMPKNLKIVLGDVRDPFFVDGLVAGHQTVFHLAALIAIPYSYVAPKSYIDTNVSGTVNVLEACRKHGVERLVHTSTSEVYGTARFAPITEDHPLQGQSPYSASKIGADKMVEAYHASFALPAVTFRPFNTYGPRQSARAVIPTIITQALAGVREIALGSLTPTRDITFVDDTVEGFLAAASTAGVEGRVLNGGTGREISVGDLAQTILRLMHCDARIVSKNERVRPAGSEVERLMSSTKRMQEATGWVAKHSLADGLTKTIEWFSKNGDTRKSGLYVV